MSPINKKCMICLYDYDEVVRRPLMLSCGHSYCQTCLKSLRATGNANCPYCRKSWGGTTVDKLPLCYQLMPEESLPESTLCQQHKNYQLLFWCKGCKVTGCKLCLSSNHRLCDWILIEDAPIMLKAALLETVEKTKRETLENQLQVRSALIETNDTLHAVKELVHTLQIVECNLERYKTKMIALDGEISHNLNLINDTAINSESTGKILSLTGLQTRINQLASLQRQYVLPPKPEFQDLERIITDFQARSDELNPNGDWKILNHRMAKTATQLLRNPEVQPVQVAIIVTKNWNRMSSSLIELLPLVASRKCDVRLRFMDTFLEPTELTAKLDNQRLDAFNSSDRRCHLKEFWGHLDRKSIKKLSNYSVMEIKGVANLQPADLSTVCDVEWWNFSYVANKERELHLHIPKTWTVDDMEQLNLMILEDYSLHLHFPGITETDFCNLDPIIQKLLKKVIVKRTRTLYLPASELSSGNVSHLLFTIAEGIHSILPIFSTVYIESDNVGPACRNRFQWMFKAKGVNLIWIDE